MDLEQIVKLISPVVFVLIWLYSVVYGDGQKATTKTSSPVFTPPRRPQPVRTATSGTAKAAESASESRFDWGNVIQDQTKQPFGAAEPSMSQALAAMKATTEARAKAKKRAESRAQAQAQATEKAQAVAKAAAAKAESKAQQVFKDFTPADNMAPPPQANLAHLVPEHFSEMHLDQAIQMPKYGAPLQPIARPTHMNDLVSRLRQPQAGRDAMIYSIVLGEPKSKSNRSTG